MSCAIYTHTPARTSSTNFQLYYFVIQFCSTNWLGHGHGYKWHSSIMIIVIIILIVIIVIMIPLLLLLLLITIIVIIVIIIITIIVIPRTCRRPNEPKRNTVRRTPRTCAGRLQERASVAEFDRGRHAHLCAIILPAERLCLFAGK